MSTIYTLKETLHDRIAMLETAMDQGFTRNYDAWTTEGRLEEARVMYRLVDQVAADAHTPTVLVAGPQDDPDRYDPGRC